MPDYLPWTDADVEVVERALKRYKSAGSEGSFSLDRFDEGVVTISQADINTVDASIVVFEIHKLQRADSATRAHWVVRLQSIGGETQSFSQHGCVSAGALVFALAKAEKELKDGFSGTATFDMAANSYWLK